MMQVISDMWALFVDNFTLIVFAVFTVWERKVLFRGLFLEPIRGGNGKTQMNELAKWVMVWVLVYMVHLEGQGVEQVYPESWGWAIIMGIFLIAGYKDTVTMVGDVLKEKFKK
jgi:hypothetical protein